MKNKDLYDDEASAASQSDSSDDSVYVVEKIVKRRWNASDKCFEYLLKWEGWPDSDNTWEPENKMACPELLEAFNKKREMHKAKRSKSGDDFVVSDDDKNGNSSKNSGSSKKHKEKKSESFGRRRSRVPESENEREKVREKQYTKAAKDKGREKQDTKAAKEKESTKSKPGYRKKPLGKILSYDNLAVPTPDSDDSCGAMNDFEDDEPNPRPSTSAQSARNKGSNSTNSATPTGRQKKKGLTGAWALDNIKKEMVQPVETIAENISQNEEQFNYVPSDVPMENDTCVESIEEEESDTGFVLDMKNIQYKIIDKGEYNGFERGWEVERILLLLRDDSRSNYADDNVYAVVKFKGFKYSHRILLSEVKAKAPEKVMDFLFQKLGNQLSAKGQSAKKNGKQKR